MAETIRLTHADVRLWFIPNFSKRRALPDLLTIVGAGFPMASLVCFAVAYRSSIGCKV